MTTAPIFPQPVTTCVARRAQLHQTYLSAHMTPYDPAYQFAMHAMSSALHGTGQATGAMYHTLLTQATFLSYLDNFRLFAMISLVALLGALLFKKTKLHAAPGSVH